MGSARLLVAVALVAVTGGAAWALVAAWTQPAEGATDAFPVVVVGRGGAVLVDAPGVRVESATALSALRAACDAAGVPVETEEYPGMGTYVRSIGGERAEGAAGWVYEVQRDGRTVSGDRSAALFALHKGDALAWRWTDA